MPTPHTTAPDPAGSKSHACNYRRPRLWIGGHRSSIHRLHLHGYWENDHDACWTLQWGDGCSDPVWHVDIEFHVPAWLNRWLVRHGR